MIIICLSWGIGGGRWVDGMVGCHFRVEEKYGD